MFSIQPLLTLFLTLAMELGLTACGAEAAVQPSPETPEPPAQVQETPEPAPDPAPEPPEPGLEVTEGTETYRGFRMDNVLHAPEGDIHYHIYIPDSYDGSEAYALFLTLPGYEGLYFQGVGENLYSERFAFEALNYNDRMIVAAPQLSDWGDTSAEQAIALTEYLLQHRPGAGVCRGLLRRRGDHVPRHGDAARAVYRLSPVLLPVGRGL